MLIFKRHNTSDIHIIVNHIVAFYTYTNYDGYLFGTNILTSTGVEYTVNETIEEVREKINNYMQAKTCI